ncbi:cyclic lactone autoinducer peptide [Anaerobacillus sp. HL2]|nr:cyclic lactone autoinducer peptide [Anaerobacillus sp. HL2]
MSKFIRVIAASLIGVIVFIAKSEISSASSILLYQTKAPNEGNE